MNLRKYAVGFKKVSDHVRTFQNVALAAMPGLLIMANTASAAADASAIFNVIIKVIGGFAIIRGAINGFSGLSDYAEAKGEGEGPAMAKAKSEIASAVMLIAIGAAAIAGSGAFGTAIAGAISIS